MFLFCFQNTATNNIPNLKTSFGVIHLLIKGTLHIWEVKTVGEETLHKGIEAENNKNEANTKRCSEGHTTVTHMSVWNSDYIICSQITQALAVCFPFKWTFSELLNTE